MPRKSTKGSQPITNKRMRKSQITQWEPSCPEEDIVNYDGKKFIIRFEKMFHSKKVSIYDNFFIKKGSYEKMLPVITKYIGFFINTYDPDKELVLAYLKLKFDMDQNKRFTEENPDQLIDLIYELIFTPTMIDKIKSMVEDNYLDDIESSEESQKYLNKEKKHLESLEFTNQHVKILLRISFGMKCIAPVLFHYVTTNVIKLNKDSDLIYKFYRRLFDIFSDDVDIYNKLFVYVN